ncbi:Leucyl aminopeptidase yscIV [Mycoemilia scoparia]|uniref:Leucyl aminopeptidase yscIV n=1 Tax=Mycoemilia scoparia TaxID=417184 RepID=A0A9W8A345_9FUNG|nr:Leucyl aminopeptidase yscIV [Mycoemilia scoparia]
MFEIDPNSQANIDQIVTRHLHLSLAVDFDAKILRGSATLDLEAISDNVEKVVLDTNHLNVSGSFIVNKDGQEQALKTDDSIRHPVFGTALSISLPNALNKGESAKVKIDYETTSESGALQFLTPEQTLGKNHPYLFTQCQAIHARSLAPCQDSPGIKITYSADIKAPNPLRALMSAISVGSEEAGDHTIYKFSQKTTMPSYLLAIVCGNIVKADISDRCAVWTEPENIDACAWEFAEMEKSLKIAEDLLTPYSWGRYDLLVLPPSFPYGGMENPCLTFVTPTLIAGDRSLTDVVGHEISHSWSGNLVTTKNWEHFWLNEGWTTFFERKIVGRLEGEDARQLSSVIGNNDLKSAVEFFGTSNPLTALVPKLDGIDPDDAFSSVPYDKGYNLLYYLEQLLGGPEVFEPYMREYIKEFQGKSITTDDWKEFLFKYFENTCPEKVEVLNKVDWEHWLYKPGMPPVENEFDTRPQQVCIDLANKWLGAKDSGDYSGFSESDITNFSTMQKVIFLTRLQDSAPLPAVLLKNLDSFYSLTNSRNSEVRFSWLSLALKSNFEQVFDAVVDMLSTQGRMKFTRPLYRLLDACPDGKALTKETFLKNRNFYHPICSRLIQRDLGL